MHEAYQAFDFNDSGEVEFTDFVKVLHSDTGVQEKELKIDFDDELERAKKEQRASDVFSVRSF